MKKTLTVNLNGRVFNIDEDAYELLDSYLSNLRAYFRKEDGSAEIISDFESRIEELFAERVKLGHEVISIEHVEMVIERMGRPEDFDEDFQEGNEVPKDSAKEDKKAKKKCYRNIDDKMLGGVCSGIAAYFGWDSMPIRLIFVCLVVLSFGWPVSSGWLILLYLILWLLIPAAKTVEQKLEMKGEPVTLENIGKMVSGNKPDAETQKKGCLFSFLDFITSLLKVFLVGLGCLVGIPLIIVLFVVLVVSVALVAGGGSAMIPFAEMMGFEGTVLAISNPVPAVIAIILLIGIPLSIIIYSIIAHFGKLKPIPTGLKWIGLGLWILALVALIFYGLKFTKDISKSHGSNWNFTWSTGSDPNSLSIEPSGVLSDIKLNVVPFKVIKVSENLISNVQIAQVKGDSSGIWINGDSNLIEKVGWNQSEDGVLELYVKDNYRFSSNNEVIIKLTTPLVEGVYIRSVASVIMENKIESERLAIGIEGAGRFMADSLYVKNVDIDLEGVGKIKVGGKTQKVTFDLEGAGKIEGSDLESDTVAAKLEGVGMIRTNPKNFLDARVDGIGKITYKTEPKSKNVSFQGVGKIGLE